MDKEYVGREEVIKILEHYGNVHDNKELWGGNEEWHMYTRKSASLTTAQPVYMGRMRLGTMESLLDVWDALMQIVKRIG